MIERDNTQARFDLGNIDIGESDSEGGDSVGPLVSPDRDIEIYQNPSRILPYSGESIELDMFDLPEDVFYSDFPIENHPGKNIFRK